jgi:hypothetical protein
MASRKNHIGTINRLIAMCGASVLVAVSLFAGVASGEGHQFSGKSSLEMICRETTVGRQASMK